MLKQTLTRVISSALTDRALSSQLRLVRLFLNLPVPGLPGRLSQHRLRLPLAHAGLKWRLRRFPETGEKMLSIRTVLFISSFIQQSHAAFGGAAAGWGSWRAPASPGARAACDGLSELAFIPVWVFGLFFFALLSCN